MKNVLRILAVIVAMMLCMSALAACTITPAEPTKATKSSATDPVEEELPEEEEIPTDFLGVILEITEKTVTVELYTTVSGELPTYKTFDMTQSIPAGEDAVTVELTKASFWYVKGDDVAELDAADVLVGDMILFNTASDGAQTIVDLSYENETPEEEDVVLDNTETELPSEEEEEEEVEATPSTP